MRLVIALGGNALLKRGEKLTAGNQRRNMREAATALAQACAGNEVAIVHGNGPQVGLLALAAEAYSEVPPYPLDVLCAESQGMIGYVVAQELSNAMAPRAVASVLTQTLVDAGDPAFDRPSKPIGPLFLSLDEAQRSARPDWTLMPEGSGYRRFVPSPRPIGIVEFDEIRRLVHQHVVTVCCGGGGIAVIRSMDRLEGVDAIIDKDLTAAMLAIELEADRLIILTDVDAVYAGWGTANQKPIRELRAAEIEAHEFAEGSMLPKVTAAVRFAEATGRPASIGSLDHAAAVIGDLSGTTVIP